MPCLPLVCLVTRLERRHLGCDEEHIYNRGLLTKMMTYT
jgi:hypothetical protein